MDESIPVTEVNVLQHDLPGDLGKLVERRAVPGELWLERACGEGIARSAVLSAAAAAVARPEAAGRSERGMGLE